MNEQESTTAPDNSQVPALVPRPAQIVAYDRDLILPEELAKELETWEEAPTWLNPVVMFIDPGDWFAGSLLRVRKEVGPNKSTLYDFAQMGTGEVVSVWGGYLLDETFRTIPPILGTRVFIMFGGYRPTRSGNRRVKTFKIYTKLPEPKKDEREDILNRVRSSDTDPPGRM